MTTSAIAHLPRPDWTESAACRTRGSSDFYPPLGGENRTERLARERRATAICATCEVRNDCLSHALRHDERYGIWGGLTDGERQRLILLNVRSA